MQLASSTGHTEPTVAAVGGAARNPMTRDLRLDFFRGLALIFIFIDHVPGNSLTYATLHAFGLSDAAEVFVLIAGYAAFLAYSGPIEREGFKAGSLRIMRRIRQLYAAHLILVALGACLFAVAARAFENPLYFEDVNVLPLGHDPLGAIWRLLVLYYQPGYLNILPLYILLLAWLPVFLWLLKRNQAVAVTISVAIWIAAGTYSINLPSWPEVIGWYFNPFAWQLLFSIGAFASFRASRGGKLPRSRVLAATALAYLGLGFLVAAPWINLPYLELPRIVPTDILGYYSKSNLSAWRLAHVLALAYGVALWLPASANWLQSRLANWVINCGRNGLDIFCLATLLSFTGLIVLLEAGRSWEIQLAVNAVGVGGMLWAAALLTSWKARRPALAKSNRLSARPAAGGATSAGPSAGSVG